jgi:prevent-host-death family protein
MSKSPRTTSTRAFRSASHAATWDLRHAKARLSELVRLAASEGPQHITVHGQERAVVLSAEAYEALIDTGTGAELYAALAACPDPDFELPEPVYPPVRDPEPLP